MLYFSTLATVKQISPAAILRRIADELHMDRPFGDTDADYGVFSAHHAIRARLLEIAAELEAAE